jgi:4-diphosphocytidyl-2-C-methyl-D-erythritol kinase
MNIEPFRPLQQEDGWLFAPAKINLFLHLLHKQPDGYHALQTGVIFIEWFDRIRCVPLPRTQTTSEITYIGPFGSILRNELSTKETEHHAIIKAIHWLRQNHIPSLPHYTITVDKQIPIGAGLGGGTSDIATIIRFLSDGYSIDWQNPLLQKSLAYQLGADVPMCLWQKPLWVEGIGEYCTSWPIPTKGFVLCVVPTGLSTPSVFSRPQTFSNPLLLKKFINSSWQDWMAWLAYHTANQLLYPAMSLAPMLAEILSDIRRHQGCSLARMTGSGSCCIGLFEKMSEARHAYHALQQKWPHSTVHLAPILTN